MIDWQSENGQKIAQRLNRELVIWLTTVRPDGTPMPTPVWFQWEGETFLIYTLKESKKVLNIANNPRAALNLNSDEYGDQVVVVTGEIHIDEEEFPANQNPEYLKKYSSSIASLKMTPESFAGDYSVPLRFRPQHWRV
jgi:PPOX class probable F420-dependent enzyme